MATAAPRRSFLGRIGLRKSVAQIQEETRTSELKRSLGPWNLVFLGIGCIIGAGIFVRTGNAAALHAGPAVLISYAIAGIICGCFEVAMSKGRVVSEFWTFLRQEKKYWLLPIVVVFVLFGLLIVFSQSSAVAPFIYTLF